MFVVSVGMDPLWLLQLTEVFWAQNNIFFSPVFRFSCKSFSFKIESSVFVYLFSTYLYPMIVTISNDELTDSIDRHTSQTIEFSFGVTITAELFRENTIGVKDLEMKNLMFVADMILEYLLIDWFWLLTVLYF